MSKTTIKFNPYTKRDGALMLYANRIENRRKTASIGFAEEPTKRQPTADEKMMLDLVPTALEAATDFRDEVKWGHTASQPEFDGHEEPKSRLSIGDLYITELEVIGGFVTGAAGAFLVLPDGKIVHTDQWIDLE